jgi:hypothetical protein
VDGSDPHGRHGYVCVGDLALFWGEVVEPLDGRDQNYCILGGCLLSLTLSIPMSDLVRHYDFPVPDAFPHVVWTLANR